MAPAAAAAPAAGQEVGAAGGEETPMATFNRIVASLLTDAQGSLSAFRTAAAAELPDPAEKKELCDIWGHLQATFYK